MSKSHKINVFELVLAAVLSVTLGVIFWGWTFAYEILKPLFAPLGMKYITSGPWLLAGIIPALIIRKPGVALISESIASLVQGFIARWGIMSVCWGGIQGFGAELVFLFFRYRRWDNLTIVLASMLSATFSYSFDYLYYDYSTLPLSINLLQLTSFLISSIFLCALPAIYLCKYLTRTGLLNNFRIVRGDDA